MSKVKSFSVGEGDMFYISHDSDNFTIIDCCLNYDEDSKAAKAHVLSELRREMPKKGIRRFISTHPDEDHISGLKEFDDEFSILNFYRVDNKATKNGEESEDFILYKDLRDDSRKSFELKKGCSRRWMNLPNEERESSRLFCLWPITSNPKYKAALKDAEDGNSPNNISPVIKYSCGVFSFLWMGDMETDMQEEFNRVVDNNHVTVLFAPHHGRESGHIPDSFMKKLSPQIVIIGEASSKDLDYYRGQNTITQNSAGDILFDVSSEYIDIFVSNSNYDKGDGITKRICNSSYDGMHYLGSISKSRA